MDKKLKVMTIVGTRPELIKLSRVIAELEKYTNHVLVHTGQNFDYTLNGVFFDELGIKKPDHYLECVGDTTAETIGNVIAKSDAILEQENPDAVLVYGDTNSCLSVISAKRRKVPVFHMEAGNRCFDQRVPEELNRKIVDHLSDINMTLTEHARRYLMVEGLRADRIIKTGSSMPEVINFYKSKMENSDVLERLQLAPKSFFLLSAHREENLDIDANFKELINSLNYLCELYGKKIIFSTHPRTMKKLEANPSLKLHPLIHVMKPLGLFDYLKLQMESFCVISDSGTITEESAILGFPAITIRNAHERPEGMDEGTVIMSGLEKQSIAQAIEIVTGQLNSGMKPMPVNDYADKSVSLQVVRIIQSYTGYINREVWKKDKATNVKQDSEVLVNS